MQPFPFITLSEKIFLLQVQQPGIESHLHSEMGNHLDLMCTKLRSTEEELRKTKDHLDLACTKLTNTEIELQNTKEHLDVACTKLKNTEEELRNTKEQLKETTQKHEERINALENKPFIYTWKIDAFQEVLNRAKAGDVVTIHSDPFYTAECGYKVRLLLYPNGIFTGKNTHLSFFFLVLKGDFDSILKWPFAKRVTFTLIDQQENLNDRENITKTAPGSQGQEDWNSRPLGRLFNKSRGIITFVPHDVLTKRRYIMDDTIFIQAKFETVA